MLRICQYNVGLAWGYRQMRHRLPISLVGLVGICAGAASAQDVRITEDMLTAAFSVAGRDYEIARNQDTANRIPEGLSLTSRPCPGYCIQPMQAAPGVRTLGEIEVISHLQAGVSNGRALLIDARVPELFAAGAIPGAVNVPLSVMTPDNPYRGEILKALGARDVSAGLDFSAALDLVVYGDGPWSSEASDMIRELVEVGYPAARLGFYRGGMQSWQGLGLSVADTLSGG